VRPEIVVLRLRLRPPAPEGWVFIRRGMPRHYVRHSTAICGGTLYLGSGPFEPQLPVVDREGCPLCCEALTGEQSIENYDLNKPSVRASRI
jgi:hypothetical protein